MAFVARPAGMRVRTQKLSLKRPSQINQAAYTGQRSIIAAPWFGQWSASLQLAPLVGEANVRATRSFLARCRGAMNTFRIPVTEGAQNSNVKVTVASTAAVGATSISLSGYTTALLDGQFFTVNGQLCQCTADQSGASVSFEPPLRAQATAGTPVVTSRPYMLAYMVSDDLGYSVDAGQVYGVAFDVAEAILGTDGATVPETELVTNGTFTTDTSGWTGSAATLSVVGGRLRVTNSGAAAGNAFQTINVIPGKSYVLKWDAIQGTATFPEMLIYDGINYIFSATAAGVGQTATVTPVGSIIRILLWADDSVAGHYADFDNISLMEA